MDNPIIIGNAELWCGDCLEILPTLGKVDAVITDPPYGMKWDGKVSPGPNGHGGARKAKHYGVTIIGDDTSFDPSPFLHFQKVVLFGANHFARFLPRGTTLIWVKRFDGGFGSFLSDAEVAWSKGGHGVYCFRDTSLMADTANRDHPTQKPLPLMRWCIKQTGNPELVLDPYMGSGTTGVACMNLGRKFIGIEIDRKYFDIACERIDRAQRQGQLFPVDHPPRPSMQLAMALEFAL